MKKSEAFPTRFLSAADLNGKAVTVTIERTPRELLKSPKGGEEQEKTVLYFVGKKKGLPLNLVNWNSVEEITGEKDSDSWVGAKVELFPTKTQMGGDLVDCIRIRAPAVRELSKQRRAAPSPSAADEMEDEIPF